MFPAVVSRAFLKIVLFVVAAEKVLVLMMDRGSVQSVTFTYCLKFRATTDTADTGRGVRG